MAAADGGGGGGHVRSKSEPVMVPGGELLRGPTRAPEGLSQRSISMDSFDFYFRGNKKADFMESSHRSVMRAVEDRRQRRRAFMENLFSRLPEPIDFGIHADDEDYDYDEDDHDIDSGASAGGDPDVDEDGDGDDDEDEGDLDIDGGDGPDVAPAA